MLADRKGADFGPRPLTDEEIEELEQLWVDNGCSPQRVADALEVPVRLVFRWRNMAAERGVRLVTIPAGSNGGKRFGWQDEMPKWPKRREIDVRGRSVIIGSDAHFWPGVITTAWLGFLAVSRIIDPLWQILNGDILDGAKISRHDPLYWERRPDLGDEIECCQERLAEARGSAPNAGRLRTNGNHDTRFERQLAKHSPEMRHVKGGCLVDHFTGWLVSNSIVINPSLYAPVMVKHAFRGGIHAIYNNVLHGGISIATGHRHALEVRAFSDYRGTRYGIDTGSLADVTVTVDATAGPQFEYGLDDPRNHRAGCAVLTFDDEGRLMPPELCEVQPLPGGRNRAVFRGQVVAEGESYQEDIAA